MKFDDWKASTDRINAGEPVPTVSASLVEHWWAAVSRIPEPGRSNAAIGLGAFAGLGPDELPRSADEHVALLTRVAILEALVERGVLDDYMKNESTRNNVFTAVASMPCDKNDLGEALAEKILRDIPQERRQDAIEEFKKFGYDSRHLRILDKLIKWMEANSS